MADAQSELLITEREWRRLKKLKRKVVSEKVYLAAQIAFQQATARALAFGMSKAQIATLLKKDDASKATGRFELYATQDGTITSDDFTTGEIIEPGRVLFDVRDESSLWVEARLTPEDAHQIRESAPATIHLGKIILNGLVTQIHHTLDESTRTLAVRIEVANTEDRLHPGLFVDARIQADSTQTALSIPVNAVLRSPDGDWQIFVEEEPGHFEAREVDVLNTVGDRAIIGGIRPGTRVVTQGAFFIQSEFAKSGFDIHNH
jgi:RND family efflux transporter MFP subunit